MIRSDRLPGARFTVTRLMYLDEMDRKKFWTAEELFKLSPAEQDALFESSIVRDLDQAPPELVARARIEQRIGLPRCRPACE